MRIPATLIEGFTYSGVSEDGCHMVLTLRDTAGEPITLGIPRERLAELIDRGARAIGDSERVLRGGRDLEPIFEVNWWALRRLGRDGSCVLSLTFGSGGQLSFALSRQMTIALRDSASALLENAERAVRGFGPSDVASSDTRPPAPAIDGRGFGSGR
jgi:hypothetical protein